MQRVGLRRALPQFVNWNLTRQTSNSCSAFRDPSHLPTGCAPASPGSQPGKLKWFGVCVTFWIRTQQVLGPTGLRESAFPTGQMRLYIHVILETETKVISLSWAVQLVLSKERKQIGLMSLLRFPVDPLVFSFWSQLVALLLPSAASLVLWSPPVPPEQSTGFRLLLFNTGALLVGIHPQGVDGTYPKLFSARAKTC